MNGHADPGPGLPAMDGSVASGAPFERDRLVDGVSCFLLGGRAWAVIAVRHDDRRVVVVPAPRGRQPTWGGFIPQYLGQDVCRKIRDVLAGEEMYGYLSPEAATVLSDRRDDMRVAMAEAGHRGAARSVDDLMPRGVAQPDAAPGGGDRRGFAQVAVNDVGHG